MRKMGLIREKLHTRFFVVTMSTRLISGARILEDESIDLRKRVEFVFRSVRIIDEMTSLNLTAMMFTSHFNNSGMLLIIRELMKFPTTNTVFLSVFVVKMVTGIEGIRFRDILGSITIGI